MFMDDSILAKIKALPPLDDTVIKIQTICMDKDSSLGDLSKVIEHDPMLTANILKASNSPLYGFSREVKSINHAVSLFGMATIRGFALSSAIRQNIKIELSPYGISNNKFLDISTLQSALMINWYGKVNKEMLDILTPASFLMEIGKIIIAHEIIERKEEGNFKSALANISTPAELSKYEQGFLGFTNEEITAKIFEQWNLELELVEAIRHSKNPENAPSHLQAHAQALQVVKSAVNIFEQLSDTSSQNAISYAQKYGLNQDTLTESIERVKQ